MVHSGYDVAQICLNGHVINDSVRKYPQHNRKFCDRCGVATITHCPNCNAEIPGEYHFEGELLRLGRNKDATAPAFCANCGRPYPWTEARIRAARALAEELENISDAERAVLAESIDEIVKDTPGSALAATRFKRILSKAGKPFVDAFRDILVDVASEAVKKMIWQ